MLCAQTSMRINDQLILEEDYDESYQPTKEGLYVNAHIKLSKG